MLRRLALAPLCALALYAIACSSDSNDGPVDGQDAGGDGATQADGSTADDGSTSSDGGLDGEGPPEVPLVPPKSGSRLKARFDKLTQNLLVFRDVYDSQINASCQEGTTSDGKLRCVPASHSGSYYYADGNCQTRLVAVNPGECVGTYAYVDTSDPNTCAGGSAYYQVGAAITPAPAIVYRKTINGCVQATPGATEFYALGAAIPDTTFAEVSYDYVNVATYASAKVLTSADGLKVWKGGFYDPLNKIDAFVMKASDDKMRILPRTVATVNQYKGGTSCNIALASGQISCGKEPAGLAAFQPSLQVGCEKPKTSLYSLGEKYNGQLYNPQTGCTPVTKPANVVVYEMGVAINPGVFAEAVPKKIGNTRIEASTYAVADHSMTVRDAEMTDKLLGFSCSMQLAADGTRRCMPWNVAQEYFTDNGCMARVFGRYPQSTCGPTPAPYGVAYEAGCTPKARLYQLGAKTAPAAVFRTNRKTGGCEPQSVGSMQFFAPGAEVPTASLVEGTPVE